MNIKKCKSCGREYPATHKPRKCECGTPFKMGYCSYCGAWKEDLRDGRCRACETIQHRAWREGRRENGATNLKKWLTAIRKIPTPYKTLTEEEWLEACKHFDGCAYCGSKKIDARSMFIPFKDGGRYCAWNIIPACEECETRLITIPNPFMRMDQKFSRGNHETAKKHGYSLDKLQKIVDYLGSKMPEEVNNE